MNYESGDMYAITDDSERKRSRRWLIIGAAVVVVLILAFVLMRPHKPAAPAGAGPTAPQGDQLPVVSVGVPGNNAVARQVAATGSLAARVEMPVGVAGEGGRVTAVLVQPGQWVGAGQVLATVDRSVQTQTAASLAAQIRVAQADATLAQSELDRAMKLVSGGYISKADIETKTATRDAANARVRVAEATLAQQRAANGRLDIRAPAAGLVLSRSVEPGQIVSAGSGVLFRIAKGGELELKADVAESDLPGIFVGAVATVVPVGGTASYTGHVWQLPAVIDPQTRRGTVRIALPFDRSLRPGGFASATIQIGANTAPVLPNAAIQTDAQGNYVYVVDKNDKVQPVRVTTGEVTDAGVAIVSGLAGNERVVLQAGAFLSPGQKIKPVLKPMTATK
ncbi:efflux RND transporter periplasmic adaptor subunit [Sphingomonas sp.]|jgi:RND family efflux transporter MFP subunit|uniref:efflux RND transporter periplasmic adaptor subunit n=1 Tax=Sphingomonas sp. TaxID=28214 RepID=UPI002E37C8C8|nr:efflux RND transporter periplasmic adaptor subunit [Sphingomonas sp.]HEX4695640.1 efflux RND transporter periplasmic adaptor subunit [Sphingomonas sp.]